MSHVAPLAILITSLLAGCGSSRVVPGPVASVRGHPISRAIFRAYVTYTAHFYASAHRSPQTSDCLNQSQRGICAVLRRQVLSRLIQEQVVLEYAHQHHIRLSPRNLTDIESEMTGNGNSLASSAGASAIFVGAVLKKEMLVRKVEAAVASPGITSGPAYHLRRFALRDEAFGGPRKAYRRAVLLATDGRPTPRRAAIRVEWIASFRLSRTERTALSSARPSDFTGPFRVHRSFIVLELLARGHHRYGGAAEQELTRAHFRRWLALAVREASPECFDKQRKRVACPL